MIKVILIVGFVFLLLFLYSACKISGDISRIEEQIEKDKK